jgi:hypothetical protein
MQLMPLPLNNQETLTILKNAFFKALAVCNESNNNIDLITLHEAENAYMCFIETHDCMV